MDNNQYTRIVIRESRSTSYCSEQEMAESCQVPSLTPWASVPTR